MNYIVKPTGYFTQVSNSLLQCNQISLKAKGIYCYLISKPADFEFSADRIANEIKEDRKSILSAIQEVEGAGYLHRTKLPNGRIEYRFFNFPSEKEKYLNSLKPESQKRTLGLLNNKDKLTYYNNNKEGIQKNQKKPTEPSPQIVEYTQPSDEDMQNHILAGIEALPVHLQNQIKKKFDKKFKKLE